MVMHINIFSVSYNPLRPDARNREEYYRLRHLVRLLRKYHPYHPDVMFHAPTLGLESHPVFVTRRRYDKKGRCVAFDIVQPIRQLP